MFKNKAYIPFYFVLIFLVGILIGQKFTAKQELSSIHSSKINSVLNYVEENYVDSLSLQDLEETAVIAILEKLDPHSIYISEEEFNAANDPLFGKFDGIGVQFRMIKDSVVVILPLDNGPSQKAGIIAGDRIVIANQDTLAGKNFTSLDIQKHLKGKSGTSVDLWIKRSGQKELLPFSIKRAAIPTFSIDAKFMLNDQTGFIKLSRFSASTIDEFEEALSLLEDEKMQNLILDLRGNTGGYLGAAIYIADQFLEKDQLIVYTEGKNRPKQVYKATSETAFKNGQLILLIDNNSASASEIVAGAIQDNDRGLLVGRRTFGKGLVQEQMNYRDGSAVRLTVSRYFTPSGRSIQRSYENGTEAYYQEFYKQTHGESLFAPDSTQLIDSLKFQTLKGRTVYGGGGIWPDVFIPADTSINFYFYNRLLNQSIIYQYAFDYVDNNRKALSKYESVDEFIAHFDKENTLYETFLQTKTVQALKPTKEDISDTKPYIMNLLKAEIARNLFEDGFYPVYLQNDQYIAKALEMIQQKKD